MESHDTTHTIPAGTLKVGSRIRIDVAGKSVEVVIEPTGDAVEALLRAYKQFPPPGRPALFKTDEKSDPVAELDRACRFIQSQGPAPRSILVHEHVAVKFCEKNARAQRAVAASLYSGAYRKRRRQKAQGVGGYRASRQASERRWLAVFGGLGLPLPPVEAVPSPWNQLEDAMLSVARGGGIPKTQKQHSCS
jgi:hypothetical protein